MSPFTILLLLTSTTGAPAPGIDAAPIQQDTLTVKEAEPGLKAQAKVTSDAAIKTALAKVPGGQIREAELEKEHGKVVYSFDITEAKRSGVEEVLVDAKTGKLISVKHESAAAEAGEQAAESKHARARDTTMSHRARMKHDTTTMRHDSAK